MEETTARLYAEMGARFLDTVEPGWHNLIDLDRLDMASGEYWKGSCGCVLAQLDSNLNGDEPDDDGDVYGDYCEMVSLLGLDVDSERLFGFALDSDVYGYEDYAELTRAWRREVQARLQLVG